MIAIIFTVYKALGSRAYYTGRRRSDRFLEGGKRYVINGYTRTSEDTGGARVRSRIVIAFANRGRVVRNALTS